MGREGRAEVLATLQHALGQTLQLAREMACDPLVGNEARAFLGRLDAIKAEVDLLCVTPRQRPPQRLPDNDEGDLSRRLWN